MSGRRSCQFSGLEVSENSSRYVATRPRSSKTKGWSRSRRRVIGVLPEVLWLPWLILLYGRGTSSARLAYGHHEGHGMIDIREH